MNELSVIIPGFNTPESWWRRCLASVRVAAPDAEIICIDDGSADGARFLDCIDGILVVHQENQGPSAARNTGLNLAHGEWVAFVDSDDEVFPDMFRSCIKQAALCRSDVVVCGVEVVWPEDGLLKQDVIDADNLGELTPRTVKNLADKCLLNYIWNKLYRRSFLEEKKIRFPLDAVMGEDLIFNFDCINTGARWSSVSTVGYRYYRTRGTLLSRYKPMMRSGLEHYSEVWRKFKKRFEDGAQVLGGYGEFTEVQIRRAEWRNAWMPHSPVSIYARWRSQPTFEFMKMLLFVIVRRYFYFRFIRRLNICRNFTNVKDCK